MATAQKIKGIKVPFTFDVTGYPAPEVDDDLLQDSILSILLTIPGERVYRPTFGSFLRYLVFSNMNRALGLRAASEVRRAIRTWEPRVTVLGVSFNLNRAATTVEVNISWTSNGSQRQSTVVPIGV